MKAKIRAEGGVFMGKWKRECQVLALGREKVRGLSVKWRREERGKEDFWRGWILRILELEREKEIWREKEESS